MPENESGNATVTWPSGAVLEGRRVTMPAGTYWVGDPCYAVREDEWTKWLDDAYGGRDGNTVNILLADVRGKAVLGIGTAYGDGVYYDEYGRDYPVDAGLIGVVPAELWSAPEGDDPRPNPFGMRLIQFDEDFTCQYREPYGVIELGWMEIMTDPPVEDDYDYDYDSDEPPEDDYFPQGEDQ